MGRNISRYIAALGCVPSVEETPQTFRTEMQCRGERENGEVFLANVFFSTYKTAIGPRLAALVVDASEELQRARRIQLGADFWPGRASWWPPSRTRCAMCAALFL